MSATRTFHFTVEGSGTFPFDMLRYDQAYPASESESAKLDWNGQPGLRQVKLATTYHPRERDLRHIVTPDRWQSFGWRVTEGTT